MDGWTENDNITAQKKAARLNSSPWKNPKTKENLRRAALSFDTEQYRGQAPPLSEFARNNPRNPSTDLP